MKSAIILAAGVGSRLRPLTDNIPKCCVPVNGTPLIRRVVQQLNSIIPNMPIYVATGYLSQVVRDELMATDANITIVENTQFATTNNMESCRLAIEARTESGSSLILNADCIYDIEIVDAMVKSRTSCIAADTSVYIDENMKVVHTDGIIRNISKAIPKGESVATSIDIYSFEEADLKKLLAIMREFKSREELNQWTEVAIAVLVQQASVQMIDICGKRWMEIDNYSDLRKAEEMFSE